MSASGFGGVGKHCSLFVGQVRAIGKTYERGHENNGKIADERDPAAKKNLCVGTLEKKLHHKDRGVYHWLPVTLGGPGIPD